MALVLVAALGVLLLIGLVNASYTAYRFDHYAETVDALITDSDLGCIGAVGGGSSSGVGGRSSITYAIAFPHRGGMHHTEVVRPCRVIPPDFGRGRGRIWIEYDREQPDRTRVVGDDTAHRQRLGLGIALNVYLVLIVIGCWRLRARRTWSPGSQPATRDRPGPHSCTAQEHSYPDRQPLRAARRPGRPLAALPTIERRPVCLRAGAWPSHDLDDATQGNRHRSRH